MSQGGIPYIGCRISLISKSGIRYEGFLFNIDTKESTVALQNVRSFGTEGRRKDGQDIPPSNNLYDYIIFRGSDIQDLKVCEAPPSAPAPQPPPHDPAIINMGQQMGHPMYGGYPQMPYPYPPYYNMPYPVSGYRGVPQQRQPMGSQGLPHPQQVQGGPAPVHGPQSRRPNPHAAQRTTHPKPEGDEIHDESAEAEVKSDVAEAPETEKSERDDQEKDGNYEEEAEEKQVATTKEESAVRDETPKESNTAGQSVPTTGLTGWADAARGAKPKPSHHGNSVQYSHSRANPAGERRSAASARKQPQQHRNPPRHRAPVPMTEFDFEKANSLFDKAKIKQELLRGTAEENQSTEQGTAVPAAAAPLPTKSYDKATSFFDSLSCDALSEDDGGKRSYAEQRRLNAETFGVHSLNEGRSHRGQGDRGNRQYQRRSNGAQHGNYGGNRSHPPKRVFVPVHEQKATAESGKK